MTRSIMASLSDKPQRGSPPRDWPRVGVKDLTGSPLNRQRGRRLCDWQGIARRRQFGRVRSLPARSAGWISAALLVLVGMAGAAAFAIPGAAAGNAPGSETSVLAPAGIGSGRASRAKRQASRAADLSRRPLRLRRSRRGGGAAQNRFERLRQAQAQGRSRCPS